MACGCAGRMRRILHTVGYRVVAGEWRRGENDPVFPDSRVEEDHFRVLIEAMHREVVGAKVARFMRKIGESR